MPRQKNEKIIDPETIVTIGRILSGTHWQSELARDVACSKSFITRAANGSRSPDEKFLDDLRDLMIDKVEGIGKLLDVEGLPNADLAPTKQAQKLIAEAVKLLRKKKPSKRAAA